MAARKGNDEDNPQSPPTVLERGATDDATVLQTPPGRTIVSREEIAAAEKAVAVDWNEGDVILDLYEVKGLLGEGGMGKVHHVHHRGWNLDLAVKSPRQEALDLAGGKENFVREAETWIDLGLHPHIVSCHYVRTLGDVPRVFAEYVEGGSLSDLIRSRRLYEGGPVEALKRILDVAIQFAWGLQYAHEKELVHQDVKPANVMLTPDGVAKVTDFGLARARSIGEAELEDGKGGTVIVEGVGMTPEYCSPEQAAGRPLTRRTDVWSWALSVMEMLVGERTWASGLAAPEVLKDYLRNGPVDASIPRIPIHDAEQSAPGTLAALLEQCFRIEPDERPRDMAEVVARLKDAYREGAVEEYARPEPKPAELLADGLNNRAVSLLDLGRREEAENLFEEALKSDPHQLEATYNRGLVLWRTGRLMDDALVKRLEEVRTSHGSDWRDEYYLGLVHMERGEAEAAVQVLEEAAAVAPDESEVQRALSTARAGRGKWRSCVRVIKKGQLTPGSSLAISRRWELSASRDGDGALRLWDLGRRECVQVLHAAGYVRSPDGGLRRVEWCVRSPDGRWRLDIDPQGALRLRNRATGRDERVFKVPVGSASSMAISPDWHWALSGGWDHKLRLWELATGRCVRLFEGHTKVVDFVAIFPDGHWALSSSKDETLRIWEIQEAGPAAPFTVTRPRTVVEAGRLAGQAGETIEKARALLGRGLACEALDVLIVARHLPGYERHPVLLELLHEAGSKGKRISLAEGWCSRSLAGQSGVSSVAISPDGRWGLSGDDKTLRVGELTTGRSGRRWLAHEDGVACVAFGPSSQLGLSGGDERVLLWDLATGECLRVFQGHEDKVRSVAISPDGRWSLSGGDDKTLRLWELATGKCLRVFEGHDGWVACVAISPDGRWGLSGSRDKTLRLWELATGRCVRVFEEHTDFVISVAISGDGRWGLSGSRDKTLRLWELATGTCARVFQGHEDTVRVAISPDGRWVLSGSTDGTRLWELVWDYDFPEPVDWIEDAEPHLEAFLVTCTAHRRGHSSERLIPSWTEDDFQRLLKDLQNRGYGWLRPEGVRRQLEKMTREWKKPPPFAVARSRSAAEVSRVAAQAAEAIDRARILLRRGLPREAVDALAQARRLPGHERRRDVLEVLREAGLRGKRIGLAEAWHASTFAGPLVLESDDRLYFTLRQEPPVAISPDGRWGLSGAADKTLRLWELATGKCARVFQGHTRAVSSVAISPDGRWALSGGDEGTLRLWELATGKCVRVFQERGKTVRVAISPDGRWALSGSRDNTLRLWELATGKCVRVFRGHTRAVSSVAISPDSRWGLSGSGDKTLRLWELATGKCVRVFEGHDGWVNSVVISPDGRWGLSGSRDHTLRLWELATGKCVRVFEGHTREVRSVAISPDGRWGLSGGDDKTLRLWELATGKCVQVLEGHVGDVKSVAMSPDGRFVLSGDNHKTLRLWELVWDYEFPQPVAWSKGASPCLAAFLVSCPVRRRGLLRRRLPSWSEDDFQRLLTDLQHRGYGWLRPDGVRRKLQKMTRWWRAPRPLSKS